MVMDWQHVMAWVDGRIEAAFRRRGLTSTGVPGSVIIGPIPGPSYAGQVSTVNFVIDGGGDVFGTGSKGYLVVDFACTITAATLLADQTGSVVVDVKRATYTNFPTTASLCAAAKPTLSSARKSRDTTLIGWTKTLAAGDVLEFVVDSAATLTRVTLALTVSRS